ncbi:MAG: hypothetical protein B9J98_05305 [Candidatus Terraquivivens tikiterensis]|uniref:Uncharacterized protein n=1 Tax=Candidatus Terraquivivens tikiterensis TaxID=1980982 RepID=A0A2R7Y2K8_9ARCH|nr:MAG: hypothetical protein B9J98_05305 [Candidatus Terraquivivens tikiterensis]
MGSIKRLIKADSVRIKIRRESADQEWPDVTQLVVSLFPELIHAFKEADASFEEKTSTYPPEYYELFVHPAVAVLPLEDADKLIVELEKRTAKKVDDGSFRVLFDGKQYTISVEYPCG